MSFVYETPCGCFIYGFQSSKQSCKAHRIVFCLQVKIVSYKKTYTVIKWTLILNNFKIKFWNPREMSLSFLFLAFPAQFLLAVFGNSLKKLRNKNNGYYGDSSLRFRGKYTLLCSLWRIISHYQWQFFQVPSSRKPHLNHYTHKHCPLFFNFINWPIYTFYIDYENVIILEFLKRRLSS